MTIKSYTTIARVVQAIQYTGESSNIAEISELSTIYNADGSVQANLFGDGTLRLNIGEWLIKKDENEFDILTDEDFALTYRQSKPR